MFLVNSFRHIATPALFVILSKLFGVSFIYYLLFYTWLNVIGFVIRSS